MFTGIIQAVGEIRSFDGQRLVVDPATLDLSNLEEGESIAVNGCCLTVVPSDSAGLAFDLSPETLAKTTFGARKPGDRVNLERAMRAGDRFGGHLVSGHVDGVATVTSVREEGNSTVIGVHTENGTLLVEKGSVAVDGISLTIVNLNNDDFELWAIPHTLAKTNLRELRIGSKVNIEFDQIAKFVQKLREPYR